MNRNAEGLPKVTPTVTCNSRTPKGLCKNLAGFKTNHDSGRCFLHRSPGRVPAPSTAIDRVTGELAPTLGEHFARVMSDPRLRSLDNELGVLRTLLEKTLGALPGDSEDWHISEVNSDKLKEIRLMADSIGKLYRTIMDVEERKKRVLSLSDILSIINQIGQLLNVICKGCPKRMDLAQRISEVQVREADFEEVVD